MANRRRCRLLGIALIFVSGGDRLTVKYGRKSNQRHRAVRQRGCQIVHFMYIMANLMYIRAIFKYVLCILVSRTTYATVQRVKHPRIILSNDNPGLKRGRFSHLFFPLIQFVWHPSSELHRTEFVWERRRFFGKRQTVIFCVSPFASSSDTCKIMQAHTMVLQKQYK